MKIVNNIPSIINNLPKVLERACEEVGVTKVADIQAITPVDSGSLRKAIAFEKQVNSTTAIITFGVDGNMVNNKSGKRVGLYAAKVEFKDKSYLRAAFNDNKVQQILLKHLRGLAK